MTDGHSRSRGAAHYAAVALPFVLAAIHASLETVVVPFGSGASVRFPLVGGIFLAGIAYLTAYFRPVLYRLGSLYTAFLGVVWVLGGMTYFSLGVLPASSGRRSSSSRPRLFVREDVFTA